MDAPAEPNLRTGRPGWPRARRGHADTFPGWHVVTGAFIVLMISSGLAFYGLAAYLNAFSKELAWEVSSISLATTLFFLVGGISGVVVSRMIARRDMRIVMVAGSVIAAGCLALLGHVHEKWQLYTVYVVFAVGWSGAGMIPATTAITRWFHVRRSVALAVASTGLSVGGVVITPVVKWALDEYGLSATTPWLGVLWLIGTIPAIVLLIKPDPQPLGWLPDGVRAEPGSVAGPPPGIGFQVAQRMWFYWAVTLGYVFLMGAQVGGIQQLVKLMEERTGAGAATLATSVLALTSVVARLVGGHVVAKFPMTRLTAALAAMQGVSLALLAVLDDKVALFAAIVLFGATVGNILMLQPLLVAERFGVRDYPRIFSRSQFITVLGMAGGPYLLGRLHDWSGGYRTSYLVAAAMSAAGAVIVATGGSATYREDVSVRVSVSATVPAS